MSYLLNSTMKAPSRCAVISGLIYASIGIFGGFSGGIMFIAKFKNYNTGLWAFLSGMFALGTMVMHIYYKQKRLIKWQAILPHLMLIGCVGQLAGICGFTVYLTLAIFEQQDLTPYGQAYYVACVFTFMTWKWSFLLFYYARFYKRLLEYLAIHDEETVNESDPIIQKASVNKIRI